MLMTSLLHPEVLEVLGRSGHGGRVLIADGNFPVSTKAPVTAARVFLNFAPGLLSVVQVLRPLLTVINAESAMVMVPPEGSWMPVHEEIRSVLPEPLDLRGLAREPFYAEALSPDTCLVIATGEQRRFANVLLTIGVVG
jgi:L-fucose mutarotase